jgi:glucosyl-3-phosphoglycerate synthase
MAGQVVSTVLARAECGRPGDHRLEASGLLTQFRHDGTGFVPRSAVAVDERPPMATVSEYVLRRADLVG